MKIANCNTVTLLLFILFVWPSVTRGQNILLQESAVKLVEEKYSQESNYEMLSYGQLFQQEPSGTVLLYELTAPDTVVYTLLHRYLLDNKVVRNFVHFSKDLKIVAILTEKEMADLTSKYLMRKMELKNE